MRDTLLALDIETAVTDPDNTLPYALEPFRLITGEAIITDITVTGNLGFSKSITGRFGVRDPKVTKLIKKLKGKRVFAHNAAFDVGWIIACLGIHQHKELKIVWNDTMMLDKWISNSSGKLKYKSRELVDLVTEYLPDHKLLSEFQQIKIQTRIPGQDQPYWTRRNYLDTVLTLDLALQMREILPASMRTGYSVEQSCITAVAEAALTGIKVDDEEVEKLGGELEKRIDGLLNELQVAGSVIASSKQLGNLLFKEWQLPVLSVSEKTGQPSTAAEVLAQLYQQTDDTRLAKIRQIKKDQTIISKYVKGFQASKEYTRSPTIHGEPRLFSTQTGRMSYQSKTLKKHAKSVALHQLPRASSAGQMYPSLAGRVKKCLYAPLPHEGIIYQDAAAQELRWIAQIANEKIMLANFNKGIDLHSFLTEKIYGTPYEDILKAKDTGVPEEYAIQRDAGKLTGISCQYRIGAKSLAIKFLKDYDTIVDYRTALHYINSYKDTYPGLPQYWIDAVEKAAAVGYAETIAGRRMSIDRFDYSGEQDAINFPIQGSAADHTEAIMMHVSRTYPVRLLAQIHDALIWAADLDGIEQLAGEIQQSSDNFDLEDLWQVDLNIDFPWDVAYGVNFKDLIYV